MGFNSPNAILSLLIVLQLGGALAFVLAGLYVLYCFNRAASGLERMADTAEAWLALQHYQIACADKARETPDVAAQNIETISAPVAPPMPPSAPHNP